MAGWLGLVPVLLTILVVVFLPESPRYLALAGQPGQASMVLRRLRGDSQPALLDAEREDILANGAPRRARRANDMPARLFVATSIVLATQLAGGYDSFVTPMEAAKLNPAWQDWIGQGVSAQAETLALSISALVCLAISLPLIETVGRRKLYLCCAAGSAVASALLAGLFAVAPERLTTRVLLSLSVAAYVVLYNVGLAAVAWVVPAEILPLRSRAVYLGGVVALRWLLAFTVAMNFNWIGRWPAPWYFGVESAVHVAVGAFAFVFLGQTRGRTLEQIESTFRSWRGATADAEEVLPPAVISSSTSGSHGREPDGGGDAATGGGGGGGGGGDVIVAVDGAAWQSPNKGGAGGDVLDEDSRRRVQLTKSFTKLRDDIADAAPAPIAPVAPYRATLDVDA